MKHNFKELLVWKKSIDLVKLVYQILSLLPSEERFGLVSQMNRSSVSIPSNIAEGSGRTSDKEFLHFLNIAISSSYELETQLIISNEIFGFDCSECINKVVEVQKMISGFKKSLLTYN